MSYVKLSYIMIRFTVVLIIRQRLNVLRQIICVVDVKNIFFKELTKKIYSEEETKFIDIRTILMSNIKSNVNAGVAL
jgi:hypothetical protein